MKQRLGRTLVVVILLAAPTAAASPEHVRARLVADSSRLEPGATVHVGVLLEMEPGWHVYWRNPGDAGLPTEVTLELPEGLEMGELRWPAPIQFEQPGGLKAYGYEESVLLATDVDVAGDILPDTVAVAAEATWLACREVCVLGSASLQAGWPLPVADAAFERWRSDLPVGDPPFSMSMTGGLAPGVRTGELTVWLHWPEPPGDVDLFPDSGASLKVSDVTVQTRGSLTRIDLTVTLLGSGSDRPAGLAAVAAAGGPTGSRRSWEISIPISKS